MVLNYVVTLDIKPVNFVVQFNARLEHSRHVKGPAIYILRLSVYTLVQKILIYKAISLSSRPSPIKEIWRHNLFLAVCLSSFVYFKRDQVSIVVCSQ